MPFQKMSTNQPLRSWSTNRVSNRQAIDRSWESFRSMNARIEVRGPIWENRFQELSRARKVGRTCYIREPFSCWATARGTCARPLFEVCPSFTTLSTTTRRVGNIGGVSRKCLLVHWKCEVEELNRISTSMPWKQAWGRDSFGTTQSRAKIRTPMQSRNAI